MQKKVIQCFIIDNEIKDRADCKSKVPIMLIPTVEPKSGFSSKAGQAFVDGLNTFRATLEVMKKILSDGRGAAFQAEPSAGVIQPWSEIRITVESYNNMVGIYHDNLICKVGDKVKNLDLRLGVIGSAVKLSGPQLVAQHKNKGSISHIELVNFGARVINPSLGESDGKKLVEHSAQKRKTVALDTHKEHAIPMKTISVENHSPRDIKLEWKVFVKFSEFKEKIAIPNVDQKFGSDLDDFVLNEVISEETKLLPNDTGILDVSPAVMHIPAFKSAPLTCSFRNCKIGVYDALVMADIEYKCSNDTVTYAPISSHKRGEEPKVAPFIQSLDFKKQYGYEDLVSVAKLRMKAQCIEPRLKLDIGRKIKIKNVMNQLAKQINNLSTISFLLNDSEAVCSFTIQSSPSNLFAVKASEAYLKDPAKQIYELKQKQSMMITVKYIGPRDDYNPFRNTVLEDNEIKSEGSSTMKREDSGSYEPQYVVDSQRGNKYYFPSTPQQNTHSLATTPGSFPSYQLAEGDLIINYTNGMSQAFTITLDAVYE